MDKINSYKEQKALAERFFRGVYGGNPSVVDELAGEAIVASYPIFRKIFGLPAMRGIEAYRRHAANFSSNWTDAEITIHHSIAEDDVVVLTWSFRAHRVDSDDPPGSASKKEYSWGGITLFEFDGDGKIVTEIGEESEPGPFGRLATAFD